MKSLSHAQLLAIPWTAAYQLPPSMGFSRQEYWSGLPLPSLIPQVTYLHLAFGGKTGTPSDQGLCVLPFDICHCGFTFTFHFHALEKAMAIHSSVLTWRIPGTGQPGGLPSMGLHRVGHDQSDLAATAAVWNLERWY